MNITGQIMIRETNQEIDGRKVVMVFGVMAAGKGEVIDLKGEHQYAITGMDVMGDLRFTLIQASETETPDEYNRGATPSQLLCSPIWRI